MNKLYLAKVFVSFGGLVDATCIVAENPEEAKTKTIELYSGPNTPYEGGSREAEKLGAEVQEVTVPHFTISINSLEQKAVSK